MPCRTNYLIQFVDTNLHTVNDSADPDQLASVCKGRVYPGSAGPWLMSEFNT